MMNFNSFLYSQVFFLSVSCAHINELRHLNYSVNSVNAPKLQYANQIIAQEIVPPGLKRSLTIPPELQIREDG